MKLILVYFVLFIFNINFSNAQNEKNKNKDSLSFPTQNYFPHQFFDKWYLHYNVEQFIDNYYSFGIQQLETTGDFSQPNNYTFSILGGSFKWNTFNYDDFKINDMFFPGASLHKPYLMDLNLDFNVINSTMNFITSYDNDKSMYAQYNNGNMGDRLGDSDDIINYLAGHGSPYQRLLFPINYRRRVEGNGLFYLHDIFKNEKGKFYQNISLNYGERMFTNLTYKGIADYYPESYLQFNINGNFPVIFKKLYDQNTYIVTYNERDQMYGEYYYSMNETAKLKELNFSVFGKKNDSYTSGINISYKNIQHNVPNFSRNVIDQDGQGLEPWYEDGNELEIAFNHKQKIKLNDNFSFNLNLYDGLMYFDPLHQSSFNTQYSATNDTNYQSLYYTQWQSNPFVSALLNNTAAFSYFKSYNNNKINYKLSLGASLDGFLITGKSFLKPNYEISIETNIQIFPWVKMSISGGKKQIPFDSDYIRFFSNDYMTGKTYSWHDLNNDQQFQPNEKGILFTTTGGQYNHLTRGLKQPKEYYVEVPIEFKVNKKNVFTFSAQYRQFADLWLMEYTKPATTVGYYQTEDVNIYHDWYPANYKQIFFLKNGQVDYKAVNDYHKYMVAAGGISWLTRNPFYAGITFDYQYLGDKLFIDASFTTFKDVGFGSIGNGPLENNLSVLSESLANPNSYINRVGRLDADRSYVGRLLISYAVNKRLTFGFQFKYKDGQPMSIFNTATVKTTSGSDYTNQVAIWNSNYKADNLFSGISGNRSDCFYNFELRTKYTIFINNKPLDLNLTIYNIFDLGFQSSELVMPPFILNGNRYADDIQIPRGFMLSAAYKF